MKETRLREILDRLPAISVAVVGDYFLDKYLIVDPTLTEISRETGKEVYQVVAIRPSPGAAGNVCGNLLTLGVGTVYAVGLLGDDGQGYELTQALTQRGVTLDYLVRSADVFTPTYTKPMERAADGTEEEMNRFDIKNLQPLSPKIQAALLEQLREIVPDVDGVIVADQQEERNCGVITDQVRLALAELAETYPDKVFLVDSRARIGEFRSLIIKPNQYEAVLAIEGQPRATVPRARAEECARQLADRTGQPVFVTLGEEGILACTAEGCTHVPAIPVRGEIDIVGAGDTTAVGIVCALCAGASLPEAALLGNLVASITIQQLGTTGTATSEQVMAEFRQHFAS